MISNVEANFSYRMVHPRNVTQKDQFPVALPMVGANEVLHSRILITAPALHVQTQECSS